MLTPKDHGPLLETIRPYKLKMALKKRAAVDHGIKTVLIQAPVGIKKHQ